MDTTNIAADTSEESNAKASDQNENNNISSDSNSQENSELHLSNNNNFKNNNTAASDSMDNNNQTAQQTVNSPFQYVDSPPHNLIDTNVNENDFEEKPFVNEHTQHATQEQQKQQHQPADELDYRNDKEEEEEGDDEEKASENHNKHKLNEGGDNSNTKIKSEHDEEDLEEGEVKDDDDDAENAVEADNDLQTKPQYVDNANQDALQHEGRNPSSHYNRRSPSSNQSYHPSQHQFNNNHHRYPSNHGPMNIQMNMNSRGGPGAAGPMMPAKVNAPCRFYSKTRNKCTWGELCRFEHREDVDYDQTSPSMARGPPPMPMGPERPYPPYASRQQPYPPPPPQGYPYEPYHNSPPPMMTHHSSSHWRPHSTYPQHPAYPPPAGSPGHMPPSVDGPGSRSLPQPPSAGSSGGSGSSAVGPVVPGGAPSPTYPSPSSSGIVYERKQQLAYEAAPWNDRGGYPPARYDREPPGPPSRGFYRNHREPPYRREPPPFGYANHVPYPSSYRGPMGSHAPYNRFMSSSQRTVLPDSRRSRSNKRRHDEDESSWSDSGSEDSFLGQGSYSKSATKTNQPASDPEDRGTGTPPGEPLPDDKPETIEALKKLKEIEDLIKQKKEEQNN